MKHSCHQLLISVGIPGTFRYEIVEEEDLPVHGKGKQEKEKDGNHIQSIIEKYTKSNAKDSKKPATVVKPMTEPSTSTGEETKKKKESEMQESENESDFTDSDSTGPYLPDLDESSSGEDIQSKIDVLTQKQNEKAKRKEEKARLQREKKATEYQKSQEQTIENQSVQEGYLYFVIYLMYGLRFTLPFHISLIKFKNK